ncbi:MAG: DUF1015 domain-containing protein [Anaerolineae bacterium]|nr:DUF1015 domain-containing protein [Anaerolineae bacterium]
MKNIPSIGVQIPNILLPKEGIDLQKWAVIACDQFTSEPEYWQEVERFVGNAPSTFHLILPEVYLGTAEETARIHATQQAMQQVLKQGLLTEYQGLILVERTVAGKTRRGLMLALDLECYDYNKGSSSLIRATEGTIVERLPPRMRIREGAALELPHIIVLLDDPEKTVIEPIAEQKNRLKKIYDFDLMLGSGHLTGWFVNQPDLENQVIRALENLADPDAFSRKYRLASNQNVLLFAMGDGNHSLATAKAIWEKIKSQVGMEHPARYALVEIENVHDDGLEFEPIHRVLFNVKEDLQSALKKFYGDKFSYVPCRDATEMVKQVDANDRSDQAIGVIAPSSFGVLHIKNPSTNLPVGTLQAFLDSWLKEGGFEKIDYVHGEEVTTRLGSMPGNLGFYLPAMDKGDLFRTVILDGALPRKTFSMGEAKEKRFYMECRRIVE